MKSAILLAVLVLAAETVTADVLVTVNPAGSSSIFSTTPGYSITYSPSDSINGTAITDNSKWNSSGPNYGSTGYEVIGSHYEDGNAPAIELTIHDLSPGPFDVFALVFTNTGLFPGNPLQPAYGSRLALDAGSLTTYSHASGGTLIALGDESAGPPVGQYEIREFLLGTQVASGGNVSVIMDDFNGELVTGNLAGLRLSPVPEPSSIVLAGLGLMGLISYAWRRRRLAAH